MGTQCLGLSIPLTAARTTLMMIGQSSGSPALSFAPWPLHRLQLMAEVLIISASSPPLSSEQQACVGVGAAVCGE